MKLESPKIYLSGPITGNLDTYKEDFAKYELYFKANGWEVINPANNESMPNWEAYMKHDIKLLLGCDYVAMLPGWKSSKGAVVEARLAKTLGIKLFDAKTLEYIDVLPIEGLEETQEDDKSPAQEAYELVRKDRQDSYGHPHPDFKCSIDMISAYLNKKYSLDLKLEPIDLAFFLILVKVSRSANAYKKDNLTDIVGYADCAWLVHQYESEISKKSK